MPYRVRAGITSKHLCRSFEGLLLVKATQDEGDQEGAGAQEMESLSKEAQITTERAHPHNAGAHTQNANASSYVGHLARPYLDVRANQQNNP